MVSYKLVNFHIQGKLSLPMTLFEGLGSVILKREGNYFLGTRYINEASDLLLYLLLRKSKLINSLKVCTEQGCDQFHLGKQISHLSISQIRTQPFSVKSKQYSKSKYSIRKDSRVIIYKEDDDE